MNANSCFFIILMLGCLALTACGKKSPHSDLLTYVAQVEKQQVRNLKPLPNFDSFKKYTYNGNDRRDPFGQQANQTARNKTLAFPMEQLKLVGVVIHGKEAWGIIETPNGQVHRVAQGAYIGEKNGRISKINKNKIEVTEKIPNDWGGWSNRIASLKLVQS